MASFLHQIRVSLGNEYWACICMYYLSCTIKSHFITPIARIQFLSLPRTAFLGTRKKTFTNCFTMRPSIYGCDDPPYGLPMPGSTTQAAILALLDLLWHDLLAGWPDPYPLETQSASNLLLRCEPPKCPSHRCTIAPKGTVSDMHVSDLHVRLNSMRFQLPQEMPELFGWSGVTAR